MVSSVSLSHPLTLTSSSHHITCPIKLWVSELLHHTKDQPVLFFPAHLFWRGCTHPLLSLVLQAVSPCLSFHINSPIAVSTHWVLVSVRTCTLLGALEGNGRIWGTSMSQWNMEPFGVTVGCYLLSRLRQNLFFLYLICLGYVTILPGPSEVVKSILMLLDCKQCVNVLKFLLLKERTELIFVTTTHIG